MYNEPFFVAYIIYYYYHVSSKWLQILMIFQNELVSQCFPNNEAI